MKKLVSIFLLAFVAANLFAAKGLVLTQKYSTAIGGQNITLTWYITDSKCKLKMEYSDKDVNTVSHFIPDLATGKLITYADGNLPAGTPKTYFTIPVQNIKGNAETSNVGRTGETKTISGILCEKIIATANSGVTEMWVTKDFAAELYRYADFFKNINDIKALADGKIAGALVSSVTKDKGGNTTASFELLSLVSKDIPDTEFAPPAGYKSAEDVKAKK
jgi:hypothetical protein